MKNYARYAAAVVGVILVIVLLVVGFNLIKNLLTSDDSGQKQTETKKSVNLIEEGKAGRPVQYTVRGIVNGDEQRRSIRFTVDASKRRVEILQGYDDKVIKMQETDNTQDAYNAFVSALNGARFTQSVNPKDRGDEAQSCPLGRRYSYEINPGTNDNYRAWDTSCGSKIGTFTGNGDLVRRLFQLQIPDYDKFVSGLRLG